MLIDVVGEDSLVRVPYGSFLDDVFAGTVQAHYQCLKRFLRSSSRIGIWIVLLVLLVVVRFREFYQK